MKGALTLAALGAVFFVLSAGKVWADDGPVISGIMSTTANAAAGSADHPAFLLGAEAYANIRLRAEVGEGATVHGAVNLVASSGTNAAAAGAAVGENYVGTLELERLFARISGEKGDADLGLLRIPFGYGQAFRPMDFLNPPNPLFPDARPRGVLGALLSAYLADHRVQFFAAGGEDPRELDGGGGIVGAAGDAHFSRLSIQGLYAFQAPNSAVGGGTNRVGLSLKIEAEVGLALDVLYTQVYETPAGRKGLELAVGADYSFLDGKLYALVQYLYNGPGLDDPSTAGATSGGTFAAFSHTNYLFVQALYRFSDFTRVGLSCLASLEDLSFSPALRVEHEPFQGLTMEMSARFSLDERTATGRGSRGELGPERSGMYALVTAAAKLRF